MTNDPIPCWANLPPELLLQILTLINNSTPTWPLRRHVIAAAGVCRSWRWTVMEIVNPVEVSGRLTFPACVKKAGPREGMVNCFIKRDAGRQSYRLYLALTDGLTDDGKFLLIARRLRRPSYSDFVISLDGDDLSKGSSSYVGKLRSNFLGTKYTLYNAEPPRAGPMPMKNHSFHLGYRQVSCRMPTRDSHVVHISYELNLLGSRGPRRMHCVLGSIPASAIQNGGMASTNPEFTFPSLRSFSSIPFLRSKSYNPENFSGQLTSAKEGMVVLNNKDPSWHEQLKCWCLNFSGRVTVASVKNFQLVAAAENDVTDTGSEKVLLQFGKVGKDLFTMDYQYPLSAFQAFAICLSSFDTKVACE